MRVNLAKARVARKPPVLACTRDTVTSLKSGDIIDGRFELEAFIGRGGMGEVWRARQVVLGRIVALKVLRAEYSALAHLRRRFAREARAAASLTHRHIASIFDFGTDEHGRMFIAMEYVQGQPLVASIGMNMMSIVGLGRQILSALAHAHARGVVHRDLKPDNILLSPSELGHLTWDAKLVDFGIATIASESQDVRETDHDQVVGTPLYMSPEQASGARVLGPSTDLYNVSFILYEIIAGAHPFDGEDSLAVMARHVSAPVPPLTPRPGLVMPNGLEQIIERGMHKRAVERWSSATKMKQALDDIWLQIQDDPVFMTPPSASSTAQGWSESAPALVRHTAKTVGAGSPLSQVSASRPDAAAAFKQQLPFVGRAPMREQLESLSKDVRQGRAPTILIMEGEAGVGKTRLLMWLKEQLEEQGVFRGHIGVFTSNGGHWAQGIKEIVESMFRSRGVSRDALTRHLQDKLARYGVEDERDEMASLLTEFLRPPLHDVDQESSPSTPVSTLYMILMRALIAASNTQPRLLILDDVQWASQGVVSWLAHMAAEFERLQVPVLVVCLNRREDTSGRGLSEHMLGLSGFMGQTVDQWQLDALSREDSRALTRAILPCDGPLQEVLTRRAAGNPQHLIALMRYVVDQDWLVFEGGLWHARDITTVRGVVPPSLADVFRARLRQVESNHNAHGRLVNVLTRCAILGRRFSYEVVRELIIQGDDPQSIQHVDADFDLLLVEGLITEVLGRGEEWYCFRYGLMRDVMLNEVLGPAQTKRLHKLAAQSLERVYGLHVQHHALDIARHWDAARDISRALDWYWQAAQMSRRAFQTRDSLKAYERVLEIMNQRLEGKVQLTKPQWVRTTSTFERAHVNRSRYLRAQVYLGDLQEGLGLFDDAERIYRRVVLICGRPEAALEIDVLVPLCEAWLGLGHIAWQRGDFVAAHWAFERVYDVLIQAKKAPDVAVMAVRGLARVAWHRGEFELATTLANQGLELAESLHDDESRAECLWILGEVARMVANHEEAQRQYNASLAIYEQAMIPTGVARNKLSQAQLARQARDTARAEALYSETLEHYKRLGDLRGQALCYNGLGELARFGDNLAQARRYYEQALTLSESMGAQYDIALATANLGLIQMSLNDFDTAQEYLLQARALIADKDFPYVLAGIEYNLALVKANQGEHDEALTRLKTALDINKRVPVLDIDFAQPLEQLGTLRAATGSVEQAHELWRRARDIYKELGLEQDLSRVEQRLRTRAEDTSHTETTDVEDVEDVKDATDD